MKLHESKILRGGIAGTRIEWFCGEFESKHGNRFIGCFDITIPERARSIFFINKGQPPEKFDFHKDASRSFEQIAFAQISVMEWDKLKNGDKITLSDEMEQKIREWDGRIWMGGSITQIKQKEGYVELAVKPQTRLAYV